MSNMTLDQLLELTREEEPQDGAFVRMVMDDVKKEEQRRWRLKLVRRPVVAGVVTAVVAMSGAVAALVGTVTHDAPKPHAISTPGRASVIASALPATAVPGALPSAVAPTGAPASAVPLDLHKGASQHTAWVLDDLTGLKLTTETYGNSFTAGRPQMVTLTLKNTSANALAVEGAHGCPLQILSSSGGKTSAPVCAQGAVPQDTVVLAPGGSATVSAEITLPTAGTWSIFGQCDCSYTRSDKTAAEAPTTVTRTSTDALGGLLAQKVQIPTLPPIPGKSTPAPGVVRLQTPAISVVAH